MKVELPSFPQLSQDGCSSFLPYLGTEGPGISAQCIRGQPPGHDPRRAQPLGSISGPRAQITNLYWLCHKHMLETRQWWAILRERGPSSIILGLRISMWTHVVIDAAVDWGYESWGLSVGFTGLWRSTNPPGIMSTFCMWDFLWFSLDSQRTITQKVVKNPCLGLSLALFSPQKTYVNYSFTEI